MKQNKKVVGIDLAKETYDVVVLQTKKDPLRRTLEKTLRRLGFPDDPRYQEKGNSTTLTCQAVSIRVCQSEHRRFCPPRLVPNP